MYEAFIRYDMEEAARAGGAEMAQVMPDLLVPESFFFPEAAVFQDQPFLPKTFADDGDLIKVRPLMSPDNYAKGILKLIRSAKKSLYLQFSYVTLPATEIFDQIIDAVSEKMNDGIDVRVILGSFQKPSNNHILVGKRKWKRSMFRIQKSKLHNKGVIIDGKIAVVGSNNWSSDGTQYNRDTSLVFFSRPIAQYYNEVFLFDWDNLTKSITTSTEITPVLAPETGPTPLGMVRIPWQAWFND
jgi:phosphatidylserine/phosphatidylglycerophosphate/cardiolipin synthase-like enzyme